MTTLVTEPTAAHKGSGRGIRRVFLGMSFLALIASNLASVFSSAFNEFVGTIVGAAGLATAYHLLKADNASIKAKLAGQKVVETKLRRTIAKYDLAVKQYKRASSISRTAIARYDVAVRQYKRASSINRADLARKSVALKNAVVMLEKSGTELRKASEANRVFRQRLSAIESLRPSARRAGARISERTFRVAKQQLARIPAEGVPYLGVAAVVAGVAYDLKAMCQNMEDLDDLYQSCGMDDRVKQGWTKYVCHPPIPSIN